MYDSSTGTFIQEDPIGFNDGGTNPYEYCNNNPTNNVDPSGLETIYGYDYAAKDYPKTPKPRTVTIQILYNFKTLKVTPALIAEVKRIFATAFGSLTRDTVNVIFTATDDPITDQSKYGPIYNSENRIIGYAVGIDDSLSIGTGTEGQTGGNLCAVDGASIGKAATASTVSVDIAAATAIAHEVGLHAVGGVHGHFHNKGYVDAGSGEQIGTAFSKDASDRITSRLDVK
jgi:uncharacterized protein RhaS with RHS repeats